MLLTGFTHFRSLVHKGPAALPSSQRTQCAYAVLSDSGRALVPSLHGTSVLPPDYGTRRASTTRSISENLSHGLGTGCLRFVLAGFVVLRLKLDHLGEVRRRTENRLAA